MKALLAIGERVQNGLLRIYKNGNQHSVANYIAFHLLWVMLFVGVVALISLTYTHTVDSRNLEIVDLGERVENYAFVLGSQKRTVQYQDLEETAKILVQDKNVESIRVVTTNGSVITEAEHKHPDTEYFDTRSFPVLFEGRSGESRQIGTIVFKTATSQSGLVFPPGHILLPAILVCIIFAYLARRALDSSIAKPIHRMHQNISLYDGESWPEPARTGPQELIDLNQALGELMTTVSRKTEELDSQNQQLQEQIRKNRQAQRELFELQKRESLTRFTSGISHDFNNILMTIMGNLEIMQLKTRDTDLLNHLDICMETVSYGAGLTSKLLNLSREGDFSPTRISLTEVMGKQARWVERVLPDNIQTRWRLPADRMPVYLDESLLVSALLNLIVNARDAMPEGGSIVVTVRQISIDDNVRRFNAPLLKAGTYYMVEVSDTGTGITPAQQKKIFEPFYTTKEEGAGTGLGLAMVKSFVEQSGGTLSLESTLGEGTTFQLYFPPYKEQDERPDQNDSDLVDPQSLASTNVLIVEDNASVRMTLVTMLEQADMNVVAVDSASDGLAELELESSDIDVLITDANLQGKMQGADLIDALGEHPEGVGVVLMSGNVLEALRFRDAPRSQYEFLAKPFTRNDLFRAIAAALSNRIMHAALAAELPFLHPPKLTSSIPGIEQPAKSDSTEQNGK